MTISKLPLAEGHVKAEMPRRDFLKTALGAVSLAATGVGDITRADSRPRAWMQEVCDYLESLRRADGGYAWADQPQSHLTPSFAAVGCYHLLGREPPDKTALVEFLRTHHPFAIKKLERDLRVFEFQQIQSLLWLGQDVSSFREQVKGWTKPSATRPSMKARLSGLAVGGDVGAVPAARRLADGRRCAGIHGVLRSTSAAERQLQQHAGRRRRRRARDEHLVGDPGVGGLGQAARKQTGDHRVGAEMPAARRRIHLAAGAFLCRGRGCHLHLGGGANPQASRCLPGSTGRPASTICVRFAMPTADSADSARLAEQSGGNLPRTGRDAGPRCPRFARVHSRDSGRA